MQFRELTIEEAARNGGFNSVVTIDADDLAAKGAVASGTFTLASALPKGVLVARTAYDLETPFDGGTLSALKLDVGFNGATVDDDDALIDNKELAVDGTEILTDFGGYTPTAAAVDTSTVDNTYGQAENDVISSLRTQLNALRADVVQLAAMRGKALVELTDIEAKFTATGDTLDHVTTGKVHIFLTTVDLTKLRN